ncbi:MAG: mandelate racemase/muconate lactonizing enzyme family protein [Bacteroidia bacterium]|nr:mandelate racemase/muconate lactonizing enzyme family protein [Bacteroidia bacterium]
MNISSIETFVLSDKLGKSFSFSQWEYSERRICIVKITTDEGLVGWGEGYGPADVLAAGIKLLCPLLMGKDPLEQETLWFEMYRKTLDFARRGVLVASISALDIALWDLKGKALNLPVCKLLGGQFRDKIMPYATGLYFTESPNLPAELADEARSYVKEGFKAIKMKVGLSVKADLRHVQMVREAIGNEIMLMVDSNHAYSLREAAELARLIEPYNIGWFEEPVSPEFYHHYKELRSKTSIPIAGGECEYLRYGFQKLLQNDSVDILQVDICGAGGLTEAKRIAALASTYGVEIIPHTWGSGIAFHTALHFIANLEPIPGRLINPDFFIEYDRTENGIREQLTHPAIQMEGGMISVPQKPGLGIEVDEDIIRFYSDEMLIN